MTIFSRLYPALSFILIFVVMSFAQENIHAVETLKEDSIQCKNQDTREVILQMMDEWKEGYNSGKAETVASLYSEDAYYLTQHYFSGIVHGRRAIQAYFQNGVDAGYHIDSIRLILMDCSDNFAYGITRYESTNDGQKAFGVNIVVLKKMDGRWFIVAHESAVPDPDTAIKKPDIGR